MNGIRLWQVIVASAVVVGAGAVGAAVGATGIVTRPEIAVGYVETVETVPAFSCVGGPAVASLIAGQRVVVVEQSADAAWWGVQAPGTIAATVWIAAPVVTLDAGEAVDSTVPVGGDCPVVVVAETPAAGPGAPPASPGAPPTSGGAGPAPDTSAPQLSGAGVSPGTIACATGYPQPSTGAVSVGASDNVGVASVSISWSGRESGNASMAPSGGSWTYTFDPVDGGQAGTVTFSMVARDAAGNTSGTATTSVVVDCLG